MAEQARKFGARIAELRDERRWKQRDLVEAMAAFGDQSLNTNQLSRYENGGAMPGEQRQSWFAQALETSVGDLHAGPLAERGERGPTPDPFATEPAEAVDELREVVEQLADQQAELLSRLDAVLDEQERLRQLQEPGAQTQGGTGT